MRWLIPVCALVLLVACAGRGDYETVSDARLGLSKVGVLEIPDPDAVADDMSDPGEVGVLPRVFEDSPPMISHTVSGYLPITRDENLCLDCHAIEGEKEADLPTPIPASHYTDLRNAPSEVGSEVAGARYLCTACHVSQTGAAPLVQNGF